MRFTCRCLNVYVDAMVDRPVEGGLETVEQLLAEHDTLPEIRDHLGDQGRLYFRFRIREKGLELRLPGFVRTEQLRAHWCRYHCILCRLKFFVNEQHVPHEILMPNDMLYKECQITMVKQLNNYSEVFQVLLPEKRQMCMSNTSSFEVELDTNYLVSLNDRQLQSFVSKYLVKLRDEMDERIKKFLKKEQKEYESNQKKVKVEKAWLLQLMAEFNRTESVAAARVGGKEVHAQRRRSDAAKQQKIVEEEEEEEEEKEESDNESESGDQNDNLNAGSRRSSSSSNSSTSTSDESKDNDNDSRQNDLLKNAVLLLENDESGKKNAANNNDNNNSNSDEDEEVMAEEIVNISPVMVYPSGPSQRTMGPDVQVEYFENRGFFDPLSVIDSNRMNIDDEEEDVDTQNASSPTAAQLPSPPTPRICSAKGVANNPESLAHPKRKRHSGGTGKPPKLNSQNEDVTQDVICCVNEFDLLSSHYLAIDSPIPHAGAGGCGGVDGRCSSKDIFGSEYNNCRLRSSNATVARGRSATGVKMNNSGMHKKDCGNENENSGNNVVVDTMQLENIPNLAEDSVIKLSTASSRPPVSEPIDIPGAGWRQDHAFLLSGQQDLHGQNQRPQDLAASMNALARSLQHHDDPERMFGERPHRRRFRTYCGGY
ncbi:Halomucin [Trichinella spiralis]|uniref:Halomucin n=1 Tax=Trichinella spiralis TaxID=6334 RepID=A0ABR3KMX4_TRISP